jgi:SAM-dependent methyltransferase
MTRPGALDLGWVNSPHVLAIGRVPAGSRVLDLGAGVGTVDAVLRRMGCTVRAVEIDPVAAEIARRSCDQLVVADLERLDLVDTFGVQSADVVLLLDVLEHLTDPAALLRRVHDVLAPTGWVVISLPHVAHASVRLALLAGRFRYTERGLLDRGHLRFFDAEAKDALLASGGMVQLAMQRVVMRPDETEVEVADADPALVAALSEDADALTYQFLVTAVPEGSKLVGDPPVLPAATAQNVALEALARAQWAEARLAELEPRAAAAGRLLPQLAALRLGSQARRESLRMLLTALEENLERMRAALQSLGGSG